MEETFYNKIIKIDQMEEAKPFSNCDVRKDFLELERIINSVIEYFEETEKCWN